MGNVNDPWPIRFSKGPPTETPPQGCLDFDQANAYSMYVWDQAANGGAGGWNSVAAGLSVRDSVNEATAAALPANTYNNGAAGVGATLTANANGALTVDGIVVAIADRVLVKNEVAGSHNGIYRVTATGDAGHPYVLTRSVDFNSATNILPGSFVFVEAGTANAGAGFVLTTTGAIVVGTTALTWTQFSEAGLPSTNNLQVLGTGSGGPATAAPTTLIAGSNVTLTGGANTITIAATPSGASGSIQSNNGGAFAGAGTLDGSGNATLNSLAIGGNAALSDPIFLANGTWITGGSGTTTKPYALIEPSGTSSTVWNTNGTGLGINAGSSGFSGNLIDLQRAGVSQFTVDGTGQVSTQGNINGPNGSAVTSTGLVAPATGLFTFNGRTQFQSPANGSLTVWNSSQTDFTIFQLGGVSNSFPGIGRSGISLIVELADGTLKTGITPIAAANFRIGFAANATPAPNILTIGEASRGGTDNNVSGANGTIQSGLGTGSGQGSSVIIQTPTTGSTGTVQETYATRLTINDVAVTVAPPLIAQNTVGLKGYTVATLPVAGTAGRKAFVSDATAPTYLGPLVGGGTVVTTVLDNGAAWVSN